MKKIILIKYGELTTKKANRNLFINTFSFLSFVHKPNILNIWIHFRTSFRFLNSNSLVSIPNLIKCSPYDFPIGVYWYNNGHKADLDQLSVISHKTVLLNLETLEEYIIDEEDE